MHNALPLAKNTSWERRLGLKGFAEALASGLEAFNVEAAGKLPRGQKLSDRLDNGQKWLERLPKGFGRGVTPQKLETMGKRAFL